MVARRPPAAPLTIAKVELAGPVLDVVLPVYGLIAVGWAAARAGRIRAEDVGRFSDLTFVVFVPALLFLAMARADFRTLAPGVPLAYFGAAILLFAAVVATRWRKGARVDAAVDGLAASFSNTVMIGIPLVRLGWGEPGLALLLSIIAFHSLVMLTGATFVFEVAAATGHPARAAGVALRRALLHPVILPILAGAAWNAAGPPLPGPVEATLGLLAAAAAPLCLVLLGASLAAERLLASVRPALVLSALKLLANPLLAWVIGRWAIGLAPLPLTIVVLTAALPIGANVFLFAQRYRAGTTPVAAAVVWSTLLAAPLLAVLLPLLPVPPR
jgi:malonate transporter